MPAPTTNIEFIDFARKSGLIHQERFDAFLEKHPSLDDDPSKIALALIQEGLLTNFQARQLLRGRYRGFAIGKYLLLEQLGEGGMGKVFLCEHMVMRRRVAIKVLTRELAADPGTIERFQREARAVASLDHPNIVRAHDVDCEGENHFIVMEYVDGASLHEIIRKKGPLSPERAAHYAKQAAVGLQAVLEAGMIHRDIKPGNLLLDRKGVLKVLDLGLARFDQDKRDAITQQFDEGSVLGTADYLSPEQAMNSHDVDIRADIYSLGATLYFLLGGRPPFEGGTVTQKLLFHQLKEPEPLQKLRPELPAELIAVVDKMMAKDPANRFQTPNEVIAALEPWTREPLAPPAEDEMPRLCLAAQRAGTPDAGPLPNFQSLTSSASTVTRASANADTPRSLASTNTGQVRFQMPPQSPFDPRLSGPRSERGTSSVVTMQSSHSGVNSASRVGLGESSTKINRGGSSTSIRGRSSSTLRRRRRRRWPLFVVAIALLAMLTSGGYFMFRTPSKKAEQVMIVSLTAKGPNVFKSITEAWNKRDATRSGRILIQEKVIEENARLIGQPGGADCFWSIEGNATPESETTRAETASQIITWRTGPSQSDRPLLHIENVPNLSLTSLRFEAGERTADIMVVAGHCPKLQTRSLSFRNVHHSGLTLIGARGSPQPLVMRLGSLTFYPSADAEAGVVLQSSPQFRDPVQNVLFHNLEFFRGERNKGAFRSGFQIATSTEEVKISQSTFDSCENGISFRKADQPFQPIGLTLADNIFRNTKVGVRFESLDRHDRNLLKAENNFFLSVPRLATVDDLSEPPPARAKWIWYPETGSARVATEGKRWFRAHFDNAVQGRKVFLDIACTGAATIWLNNRKVGEVPQDLLEAGRVASIDVSKDLLDGKNLVAVVVERTASNAAPTAAGLLCHLGTGGSTTATLLASDAAWRTTNREAPGWTTPEFSDASWKPVVVLGNYSDAKLPWKNLTWDSEIKARFSGRFYTPLPNPTGNLRDEDSFESFPNFASLPVNAIEIENRIRQRVGTTAERNAGVPIPAYLVAGPFDGTFAEELPPERNPDPASAYQHKGQPVNWEEVRLKPGTGGKLDLAASFGPVPNVAYAMVWIHSPREQEAELQLQFDDAVKVWQDGKLIFEKDEHNHGMDQPATPIKTRLQKGANKLFFKVVNYQGAFGLACRIKTGTTFTYSLKPPDEAAEPRPAPSRTGAARGSNPKP